MCLYSAVLMRFAWMVQPRNYLLLGMHASNEVVQLYQFSRRHPTFQAEDKSDHFALRLNVQILNAEEKERELRFAINQSLCVSAGIDKYINLIFFFPSILLYSLRPSPSFLQIEDIYPAFQLIEDKQSSLRTSTHLAISGLGFIKQEGKRIVLYRAIHRRMAVEEELGCKKPHFFRVLLPEFTEKMLLPRAFTQHIEPENRQKATILSPLGKFWHVDLKSDGRQLFFGDGWKEFARAHDFAVGFFLVFRYEGNLVFTIRVFDLSCCQKAYSKNNARRYSNQSAAMFASMSADETLDDDNEVEEEEKEEGEEEDIDDDDDDDEQEEEGDDEDNDDDDYEIKFTEAGSSNHAYGDLSIAWSQKTTFSLMALQQPVVVRFHVLSPSLLLWCGTSFQFFSENFCLLVHDQKMATVLENARRPQFFKVLLPGFSEELLIPPRFSKNHVAHENHRMATIMSPLGNLWQITLEREGGDRVYFSSGWEEFARAHELRVGFVLVFRYEGNMVFGVKVFDLSGCLKEYDEENARSSSNGSMSVNEEQRLGRVAESERCILYSFGDYPTEEEEEEDDKDDYGMKTRFGQLNIRLECCSEEDVEEKEKGEDDNKKIKSTQLQSWKKKGQPEFVKKIGASTLRYKSLIVPKQFCSMHGLIHKQEMVLKVKDMEGRYWSVDFRHGKNQNFFKHGWEDFSQANNLEIGDRCVFQLVSRKEMHVEIEKHRKF
ncbi:B3 domain-containing protein [Canna indica]|uniref:B3 domain-containing protein n=1 Tax=Canna indica TaxID=4628 RepID=A0AAQ3JUX7_9LILI|nr:B3 domain-containing protein [Canna indica]